jgi:hypothetical protein
MPDEQRLPVVHVHVKSIQCVRMLDELRDASAAARLHGRHRLPDRRRLHIEQAAVLQHDLDGL